MDEEEECCFVESIGGVDEVVPLMSNVVVFQLVFLETQVLASIFYSHMFICWGFLTINNVVPMDLVKPQML
jgi:hypothetical protein